MLRELGAAIAGAAPGAVDEVVIERGQELVLRARREQIRNLMTLLKTDPRFAFEQMVDLCGVDWPDRPERFEVVYNLLSLSQTGAFG
jgi:NADH-quinone oxidoreductase subunit C